MSTSGGINGDHRAAIHVADRAAELVREHDQNEAGRDDLRQRAGRRDDTACEPVRVAVAHHDGQRNETHRNDRRGYNTGGCGEQSADQHDGVCKPAAQRAEELADRVEQFFGHAASLQHQSHERKEGDREQRFVAHDAEDAFRQGLQKLRTQKLHVNAYEREQHAVRRKRERDGIAKQQQYDERAEHERRDELLRHQ
jgi:hypothetical protein